jgi:ABC-2 type transport system permease protein
VIRRVLRLTRFELRKLAARPLPVLAVVLVVLVALLAPWAGHAVDSAAALMKGQVAREDAYQNGWTALAGGVAAARLFIVIVLLILSGSAVAEEAAQGTLKTLLVRPVRRTELLVAKALATWGWAVLLLVVAVLAAALAGELTKGLYDVQDPDFGVVKHTFGVMLDYTLLATALTAAPLLALTGLGLLATCLSDHPGHATGGAIGALFLLSAVAGVSDLAHDLVFVSYSAMPFQVLEDLAGQFSGERAKLAPDQVVKALTVCLAWAGVTLGAAATLLRRRDIGG